MFAIDARVLAKLAPTLRRVLIVGSLRPERVIVLGNVSVRAPESLDLPGVHVEDGYPAVPVPVRHVGLLGRRVERDLGGPPEVLGARRAELFPGNAVLGQERPVARELEDVPITRAVAAIAAGAGKRLLSAVFGSLGQRPALCSRPSSLAGWGVATAVQLGGGLLMLIIFVWQVLSF